MPTKVELTLEQSQQGVSDDVLVMDAPTIPVSAKENLGDPIDIRVDIIHLEPVGAVAFPTAAVVRTQAQHGEAIRSRTLALSLAIARGA
ncbi:hypothetical protein Tco_0543136 [Tanacetum coccineum]